VYCASGYDPEALFQRQVRRLVRATHVLAAGGRSGRTPAVHYSVLSTCTAARKVQQYSGVLLQGGGGGGGKGKGKGKSLGST
jgi:hypothetical protein